jgi:hypothetical protein
MTWCSLMAPGRWSPSLAPALPLRLDTALTAPRSAVGDFCRGFYLSKVRLFHTVSHSERPDKDKAGDISLGSSAPKADYEWAASCRAITSQTFGTLPMPACVNPTSKCRLIGLGLGASRGQSYRISTQSPQDLLPKQCHWRTPAARRPLSESPAVRSAFSCVGVANGHPKR